MQRPLFQGRLYPDHLSIRTYVQEDVYFQKHSSSHYSPSSGPHEQNTVTPNLVPQSVTHCSVNPESPGSSHPESGVGEVLGQHCSLLHTRRSPPPGYNGGQARDGVWGDIPQGPGRREKRARSQARANPAPLPRPAGSLTTEALSFESVHGAVGRAAPGSRRAPTGLPLGLLGLQEPRGGQSPDEAPPPARTPLSTIPPQLQEHPRPQFSTSAPTTTLNPTTN